MASLTPYPSGSDIIAPLPLYTPDFSAINTMMQKRAAMFEQGLSQVKSSDSLIRNAALSVSDNQVVRDQYIKQAEEQLKKLQGADFSQIQNVEAAQQVYAPFWQDKELLEDYSKTSAINAERSRAESLMQSNDPKVREQFWKTGLDYVNLSAADLSLAKRGDGSIGRVKVNKYVPFFDTMAELQKRAKDQGLKIERDMQGGPGGVYKITRINGDESVPLFKEWAANEIANMPEAAKIFEVQGTVDYRTGVQNLMAQGYDEPGAKRALAENYMSRQREYYTNRFTDISDAVTEMTQKLDAMDAENQALHDKNQLTPEKLEARRQLAKQLEAYKNTQSTLKESADKFSATDSKEYQDQLGAILNGGEKFFANHYADRMIDGFARNQALNSSVKIDIDPVTKVNLEMQKFMAKLEQDDVQFGIRYGDGTSGATGSSSRSGSKKKDEGNPLDNPVYMGATIMGKDPLEAQNRLATYYKGVANEYMDTGLSIINEANMLNPSKMISPAYQDYLKQAMTTGKYSKPSAELLAEHKRLQDEGIVNASFKLGDNPSEVFNSLYKRSVDLLAGASNAGSLNPNVFGRIQQFGRLGDKFQKLRELNGQVEMAVTKDPMFKGLLKDGKIMTKAEFIRNTLGYSNKDAYIKSMSKNISEIPGVGIAGVSTIGMNVRNAVSQAQNRWEQLEEQYDKIYGQVKDKTAKLMQRYIGVEGAVIGQTIRLNTDLKDDREQVQDIVLQATSTANMPNQIVDKDGVGYPVNIDLLVQKGADRDKIKELLDLTRGNIDNMISGAEITKVGITGKPTVKVIYNIEELKKFLGEKKFSSEDWQGTLKTLNMGLEFAVDKTQIKNFEQDFDLPGAADVAFDQNRILKAPASVKPFGFDYTILKDPAQNQYIINFQYNDKGQPKQTTFYAPLQKSLTSVQQMIEQNMFSIYTQNQQALRNSNSSGNFINSQLSYKDLIR